MRQVEIPGGTAQFRDRREEINVRQQRVIDTSVVPALPAFQKVQAEREKWENAEDGVRLSTLTRQESAALMEFQDGQIVALLASWTLPTPLPDMETIQDLSPAVYASLLAATMEIRNTTDVFERDDFTEKPGENPTVPSSDSDESAREAEGSGSTETLPTDGESSATGSSSKSRTRNT